MAVECLTDLRGPDIHVVALARILEGLRCGGCSVRLRS
jgi:hypothetical protein